MELALSSFSPHADGVHSDTDCFQQALDHLAAHGGGRLTVEAGRYVLGGIRLPSHCILHLSPGAVLIASDNYDDYACNQAQSVAECSDRAFIYARNACDIGITGSGKIDGNGSRWFSAEPDEMGYRQPAAQRPRMVVFEGCEAVSLSDFSIEQAPMWTVHLVACQDVKIRGIAIRNDLAMANTDALDLDCCQRVQVSDCHFSAADDGICLKTVRHTPGLQRRTSHIVVSNCYIRSKSCAIKIGTETAFDVEDVIVTNCTLSESNRGIGLVSRDGGNLRRMIFSNITFDCRAASPCHWGKADPLYISVRHRDPNVEPGEVAMIQFRGLSGCAEGAVNFHSEIPGKIRHIVIDNLQMEQLVSDSADQGFYDVRPPCNPASPTGTGMDNAWAQDPQSGRMWGVMPYPAGLPVIYAYGVKDLRIQSCTLRRPTPLPSGWCSDKLWLKDCDGAVIND